MWRIALVPMLLLPASCAAPARSPHVYPFDRAATGLAITDADWTSCDRHADRYATGEAEARRTAPAGLGWFGGAVGYAIAVSAIPRTPPPPEPATYERAMRVCLVNRGYAIMVPDPPPNAFGKSP